VDSSLDWGQDLPALKRWMDRDNIEPVFLAYFGTADPRAYGVRYKKVVMVHDFRPGIRSSRPGPGDWFVISRTLLQGAYLEPDKEFALAGLTAGRLRREWIDQWAARCRRLQEDDRPSPHLADWLVKNGKLTEPERAALARPLLTTWIASLRNRKPDRRIGGSMVAFRMTPEILSPPGP